MAEDREKKNARRRARYAANREKELERARAKRAANPEKVRAKDKARRDANPEKARAKKKAWRDANPEKVRAKQKAWRDANPEKILTRAKARHAAMRKTNPPKIVYLAEEAVSIIKAYLKKGVPQSRLGRCFKVSKSCVARIARGVTYADVQPHANPPPLSWFARPATDEKPIKLRDSKLKVKLKKKAYGKLLTAKSPREQSISR